MKGSFGGAVGEVDHEQAAEHGLAVVGEQWPGNGDALGHRRKLGLVLGPHTRAKVAGARAVEEVEREQHRAQAP